MTCFLLFLELYSKAQEYFYTLTIAKRLNYIENAIQKDIKFRNSLKGIIIGHFTMLEYENYVNNSSALNKRMMNIVKERLESQMQLLEPNSDEKFDKSSFLLFLGVLAKNNLYQIT